jgi:hypothetical protein
MPVIIATREAKVCSSKPAQVNNSQDPISKKKKKYLKSQKMAAGVAQGVGPEFKPQYQKKIFFSRQNLSFYGWCQFFLGGGSPGNQTQGLAQVCFY